MKGDKKGLSFLRINGQYKLEFREIANAGNQAVIEICSLVVTGGCRYQFFKIRL